MTSENTERVGVNAVEGVVLRKFKWFWREQPIHDHGIDGHIESTNENGKPTGALLGVQIKSGPSHFHKNADGTGLTFYFSERHYQYWLKGTLPMIICAYLPDEDKIYWQFIEKDLIEKAETRWKLFIPFEQEFTKDYKDLLSRKMKGGKINTLHVSENLMRAIESERKVLITFDHYVNKTLNMRHFEFLVQSESGEEDFIVTEWSENSCVAPGVEEFIKYYFPWANPHIDTGFYIENYTPHIDIADMVLGMYEPNPLDAIFHVLKQHPNKKEDILKMEFDQVFPYRNSFGEAEHYRLELKLNELGKSYLKIMDFVRAD